MEKYIIELETKINDEWCKSYHQMISQSNRKDTMNVYEEHITFEKKQAKRFYDKEEAEKYSVLLTGKFQKAKVITVKR